MRELETRVLELADHPWTFDAESRIAERHARHVLERHAVHALLIEIVHVLAIGLAIGDDVETEITLVLRRPTHHFVGVRLSESRLLHRVGGLGRTRIAADHCVAVSRHASHEP